MILKPKDSKNDLVLMVFGTGDIGVSSGCDEEGNVNEPTDIIFDNIKARPIGVELDNIHVCTTDLDTPVVMRFTKPESIDVITRVLEKIKAALIKKQTQESAKKEEVYD